MTVYLGSRYQEDRIVNVLTSTGERQQAIFHPVPSDLTFTYDERTVVEGDRLDLIAYETYANAELWWVIADANPELGAPEPLIPGSRLRVPRGS